jgi:nuclear receptor interaction protein
MNADHNDNEDYVAPNGLSSRRRMHDSYRIMQANNVERESGAEEAIISVSLTSILFSLVRVLTGILQLPRAQLLQLLLGQLGNAGVIPTFLH